MSPATPSPRPAQPKSSPLLTDRRFILPSDLARLAASPRCRCPHSKEDDHCIGRVPSATAAPVLPAIASVILRHASRLCGVCSRTPTLWAWTYPDFVERSDSGERRRAAAGAQLRRGPYRTPRTHIVRCPQNRGAFRPATHLVCGVCSRLRVLQVAKARRLWSLLAFRMPAAAALARVCVLNGLAAFRWRTRVESSRATLWRWRGVTGGG
jgi:hypothetical protein